MYAKILIATDGSDLAGMAVTQGLKLAGRLGSQVLVVTVTDIWSAWAVYQEDGEDAAAVIAAYEADAADHARKVLDAAAEQARAAGIAAQVRHVKDKHPSDGIIEAADAAGADLIVMASHGRRGVNRVLLGSQTQEVLSRSKIPVLVLR